MAVAIESGTTKGKIIRKDTNPDGTEIWLVCEEAAPPDGASGGSVGVLPDEEDEWYPLGAEEAAPTLIVDTTALAGRYRFNLAVFTGRAARYVDAGTAEVILTSENASEWGLIRDTDR